MKSMKLNVIEGILRPNGIPWSALKKIAGIPLYDRVVWQKNMVITDGVIIDFRTQIEVEICKRSPRE